MLPKIRVGNPLVLVAALVGLLATPLLANAQVPTPALATVDENGNGRVDVVGGPFFVTGTLQADPGPGGLPSVLTYSAAAALGQVVVGGDVLLQDDGPNGPIFDVIRFNPSGTGNNPDYPPSLLFYSDNVDGFDSLADTPSPPRAFYTNTVTIPEVGPEGDNGAIYTPTANEPGFVPGFAVTYDFISDSPVPEPEPASLALLGAGLMGLSAIRRKQR